jgi:hypothetical protein
MSRQSIRAAWATSLLLGFLLYVQPVAAQVPGGFLRLNGVYPATTPTAFDITLERTVYDETAAYDIRQQRAQTIFYDGTLGARIWRGLAAAVSVSYLDARDPTVVSGSIPSPLFVDSARKTSISTELDRRQIDFHLQAIYFLPTPSSIDIALSAGPSVLRVTRSSVSGVTLGREIFPFQTISIAGLETTEVSEMGIGTNIGADIALMPTRVFGVGFFIRYVTGNIDSGSRELDVGGLQAGAGLRFRF